jgi:hypothetical protein
MTRDTSMMSSIRSAWMRALRSTPAARETRVSNQDRRLARDGPAQRHVELGPGADLHARRKRLRRLTGEIDFGSSGGTFTMGLGFVGLRWKPVNRR